MTAVNDVLTWGAMIVAGGSIVAVISFWMNLGKGQGEFGAKITSLERDLADSKSIGLAAHSKISLLESAFGVYRERIAQEYVSRQTLREVEDRISGAIEKLGDRLDRSFEDRELRRQK